jgi:hypothetical protein
MNTRTLHTLSYVVFFLGVLVGFAVAVIMIWNRLEAISYFFTGARYDPFEGLRCPVMIAPTEEGRVTAAFRNPSDREDTFFYRAEISGLPSTRRLEGQITVPPRQTKRLEFTVDAEDVDLKFFIFVKLNLLPHAGNPFREAVCGMMVIHLLGLSGTQIVAAALSLSILGMILGFALWQKTKTRADESMPRIMAALSLLVLLALFAGFMGWWLPGMALAAITILMAIVLVRFAID